MKLMMNKVRIIVESSSNYAPEIADKLTTIPLIIRFGTEEYIDGVTISHREFYEKLATSNEMPATSQVAPEVFSEY